MDPYATKEKEIENKITREKEYTKYVCNCCGNSFKTKYKCKTCEKRICDRSKCHEESSKDKCKHLWTIENEGEDNSIKTEETKFPSEYFRDGSQKIEKYNEIALNDQQLLLKCPNNDCKNINLQLIDESDQHNCEFELIY